MHAVVKAERSFRHRKLSNLNSCEFPRHKRLLTAAEYRAVFEKPFRVHTRFFTLLAMPNGQPKARLGIAVAKKNVRHAVSRNKIKRQIRESFRQTTLVPGLDIVVLAKREAGQIDISFLAEDLNKQWKHLSTFLKKQSCSLSSDTKSS